MRGTSAETVQALLGAGAQALSDAGVEAPQGDARRLLAFAMAVDRGRLSLLARDAVTPEQASLYTGLIARRAAREPLSHLVGTRAFYGRDFRVSPAVLDPRPETETLVEAALAEPFGRVLDLGTGSGCILLSLLAERPGVTGIGTDISPEALGVAGQNAEALGVADRCGLIESNWFAEVAGSFDLIVSNPPYIAAAEIPELQPELSHEPRGALTDEGDGLSAYRRIAAEVSGYLRPGGRLLLEIGPSQGAAVGRMVDAAGLVAVEIRPDLDGRDRVVTGRKPL